jgi:NAD(P)-dependent dehydrogenase (short-subunit alcohol dehydrogenase family)
MPIAELTMPQEELPDVVMPACPVQKLLKGQKALVTGGNSGIGRGIAIALAHAGADVVINYHSDAASAEEAVEEASLCDSRVISHQADVSKEDDVRSMYRRMFDEFGTIDILVNNAGLYASLAMRPFTQIPPDEWRTVMDVNVASMFLTCRAVVPVMQSNGGGKIVNISSGTPFRGVPFLLHYVTSKGAIVAFTRALAKEVGRDGVLVNCVAPGFTMSAGVEEHPEVIDALREVSVSSRTIQRDQVPEDVVGAVVYLSGAGSAFVTGQTIVIDGGQYFH